MNRRNVGPRTCIFLATGLMAAVASQVVAQTVIDACYVEKTGVIYRIDPNHELPGSLPADCIKPDKHVRISWVDGEGAILADGVTPTTNGFAVIGDEGVGVIPMEGSGNRLMWYPGKAAFRAGVGGSHWNEDNIGYGSAAMGSSLASGSYSTALGEGSLALGAGSLAAVEGEASGDWSVALGNLSLASADRAFASAGGKATGEESIGIGYWARADAELSTAIGPLAHAGAPTSAALGPSAEAEAPYSLALGGGRAAGTRSLAAQGGLAEGNWSLAIGYQSRAAGDYSVAVGYYNQAVGRWSTALGANAVAGAESSFAGGDHARVDPSHTGAFLWADEGDVDFVSAAAAEFAVRARGGVRFVTAADGSGSPTAGAGLAPGGSSWLTISDRSAKENFRAENGEKALAAISAMPVESWNYRTQDASIRHIGPTAQDFRAAFGFGEDELRINTVDIDGVNMLAIQALETRTRALRAENDELRDRLARMEAMLVTLMEARR